MVHLSTCHILRITLYDVSKKELGTCSYAFKQNTDKRCERSLGNEILKTKYEFLISSKRKNNNSFNRT